MRWRELAARLKQDALLLWVAARHPEVPFAAKITGFLVAAYAFSPIDLIPDVVPVLGLIDDLLIVPFGVWVALKLVPRRLRPVLREAAAELASRPTSLIGLGIVAMMWLLAAVVLWRLSGL